MTVEAHGDAKAPQQQPTLDPARLSKQIAALDPGSAAALRRGPATGAGAAAFWKLLADHGDASGDTAKWATLVQAIAILTPPGPPTAADTRTAHDPKRPMGEALHDAGVTELRLARLLAAKGDMRGDLLIRLCRRLARDDSNRRLDLRTLAWFVIAHSEEASRRIARDYYRAASRNEARQRQNKEA